MADSRAVRFHHGDKSLKKNKHGEIVSATKSKQEKANPWIKAVQKARKELHIKKKGASFDDYVPKKGTELYKLAKQIHGAK